MADVSISTNSWRKRMRGKEFDVQEGRAGSPSRPFERGGFVGKTLFSAGSSEICPYQVSVQAFDLKFLAKSELRSYL
jgi:hypothetical protein